MWDRLDVGAWVGIIALILAFPVAVMGHLFGHRLLLNLERLAKNELSDFSEL
jgi:hypothetical protein